MNFQCLNQGLKLGREMVSESGNFEKSQVIVEKFWKESNVFEIGLTNPVCNDGKSYLEIVDNSAQTIWNNPCQVLEACV